MRKVICFGEIMLRLNPPGFERIRQADCFEISFAGSEANVAVSLANWDMNSSFVTKLPRNDLGKSAQNVMQKFGVNTTDIAWGETRLGVYFVEKGASQRASKVIYDRLGSSFQLSKRSDYDWEHILDGANWFHFSGITPALGGALPDICLDALVLCKKRGIPVSCDLNYRSKLWSRGQANYVMSKYMPYVNVLIANESDAEDVFDIKASGSNVENGILSKASYEGVAKNIVERFGMTTVAITLRTSISASINKWAGMIYDHGTPFFSPEYMIQIVDRVGAGDSFSAGLIYAFLNGYTSQEIINFAAAASCLKHTIEHDFNLVDVEEVQTLASGNTSGRVQR